MSHPAETLANAVDEQLRQRSRRHQGKQTRPGLFTPSPLADPALPDDGVLVYVRASSTERAKPSKHRAHQEDSPELQLARITAFCEERGYPEPYRVFVERQSGKSFAGREVYNELKTYVLQNALPDSRRVVVCYDIDRFTRELDRKGEPDLGAVTAEIETFKRAGWHLDFVETPMARNATFSNYIMLVVKAWQAGEYIRVLGSRVRSAKVKTYERGHWLAGTPPFPAMRVDAVTGRRLEPGEYTNNGSRLARDPQLYPAWELAAKLVAAGKSCGEAAEQLHAGGYPLGATMRGWSQGAVRRMLSNSALVAQPVVYLAEKGGVIPQDAAWEPVVDPQLFAAANARLLGRRNATRRASGEAVAEQEFLLAPVCEACGAPYYPSIWRDRNYPDTQRTRYIHRATKLRSAIRSFDWFERAQACGCRDWSFNADQAHEQVRQLIASHRTTKEFVEEMLALRSRAASAVAQAHAFEAERHRAYLQAESEYAQFCANIGKLTDPKVLARLESVLQEQEREVERKRQGWVAAREQTAQVVDDVPDLAARVNFTRQVLDGWEHASREDRKQVFDWWLDAVLVRQGPKTGKRGRHAPTELVVVLRTNPNQAHLVEVGFVAQGRHFSKCHPCTTTLERYLVRLA